MLGLTEEEFWGSTLAKVRALYEQQEEWWRRRDFFPAQVVANGLNRQRTKATDLIYSADEVLAFRYPKRRTKATHDPDHGAQADWTNLKAALKSRTKAEARKRKALTPHAP